MFCIDVLTVVNMFKVGVKWRRSAVEQRLYVNNGGSSGGNNAGSKGYYPGFLVINILVTRVLGLNLSESLCEPALGNRWRQK